MNALRKEELVVEVPVLEVSKKLRLRPWVKVVGTVVLALGIGSGLASVLDARIVSEEELLQDVQWVEVYAQQGDGYEVLVRNANGSKDLDIKMMSTIMQDKNHHVELQAGHVYQVPVLEAK